MPISRGDIKGEIQVHLPFEFDYSDGGTMKKETMITVRAPSFADFKIHNAMVGRAKSAEVGTAVALSGFKRSADDASPAPAASEREESDAEMVDRVIGVYAMGLGDEKFSTFMEFVKATLTNNPRLAAVGETKIPIKDAVWEQIGLKGGMDAVNLIISAFAGFFLTDQRSRSLRETGESSSTSSRSERVLQ